MMLLLLLLLHILHTGREEPAARILTIRIGLVNAGERAAVGRFFK